jgi:CubicO group peptidase (beta-lactamase class C family)
LLRALACGALMLAAALGPRRRHIRYSGRARFNQASLRRSPSSSERGRDRQDRRRERPDPAARQGVYHETFGVQDVVSKTPITDQTIFRLSSLTKVITSVVAMQLIEDGKIKLDDPVSKYIPSFANMKVGVEKKAEDGSKTLELVALNPADHRSRPDASYLRYHLWLLWRQPGAQGLRGGQYLCRASSTC